MTKEQFEAYMDQLGENPQRIVSHGGRTASTISELNFIAKAEGDYIGDQNVAPVGSPEGHENGGTANPGAITTESGIDAMSAGLSDMVKADLIEVAKVLGVDPVPDKADEIREAVKAKREELKAGE